MRVTDYLGLLADSRRVDAFRRAIETSVSAGDVVLDLGTGLGTYAIFAARAGARVYAVESDPVIEVARTLAAENGVADRVVFLRGRAEDLEPPERADVLVFEDFAPFLCQAATVRLLEAVRGRWLRDTARAIPRALTIQAAPVCCPANRDDLAPWNGDEPYGLSVDRAAMMAVNDLHHAVWGPDVLLARPMAAARFAVLEPRGLRFSAELQWQSERPARLDGLGVWLDMELADGVDFSNAPNGRADGWAQVFLPLLEPVRLESGDRVGARLAVVGDGGRLWWCWRLEAAGDTQEMSTFRGAPLSMGRLRQASPRRRPGLTPLGAVRGSILELAGDGRSVAEIAAELWRRFPGRFDDEVGAMRAVAEEIEAGSLGSGSDAVGDDVDDEEEP
jgi:protein arginine N-methyltransferase 1